LIESAVASNRIEGVEIGEKRVGTVVFGQGLLTDRNEEEVRGYQDALSMIHNEAEDLPFSVDTILKLHAMTRPNIWDSGKLKDEDGEIIEKHPDGKVSIRFLPVSAKETPVAISQYCSLTKRTLRDRNVPPLVLWAAGNLDFLCIHPFRDGNGRVSRLLLLLGLYHIGFEAGRYISLESIIEQSKERYYETLRISSERWHDGKHDPWPYINYLLYTLKAVYQEFEDRYENANLPKGEKTEAVQRAALRLKRFHITELSKACPEVSVDMIRKVLSDMRTSGVIECTGRGKHARWRVIGNR